MVNNTEQRMGLMAQLILESIVEGSGGQAVGQGIIYAALMGHLDLATFNYLLTMLERAGLVTRSGHSVTATDKARAMCAKAST